MSQSRSRLISLLTTTALISGLVWLPIHAQSQTREDLEAQRNALLRQIETNTRLLSESKSRQQSTLKELGQLRAEVDLRQKVLNNYQAEINILTRDIDNKQGRVTELKASSRQIAEQHVIQLKDAYYERRMDIKALYLLSAGSLNEAFRRWRFIQVISRARRSTFDRLVATSDSLTAEIKSIQELRSDKQVLAENTIQQEKALSGAVRQSESALKTLKGRESEIRAELDRQKRESERLANEIERIIRSEVEKSSADASMPLAPALKALSDQFEANKGSLPWPVERGIITGQFGEQPHPVVPSIVISNNGIDITTEPGSRVNAVFGGKVVGLKTIPGYDFTVIVQHGSFYTVYSRLVDVAVEMNDDIKTGQMIGRLHSDQVDNPELHFEVWQNKAQVNPESWISN